MARVETTTRVTAMATITLRVQLRPWRLSGIIPTHTRTPIATPEGGPSPARTPANTRLSSRLTLARSACLATEGRCTAFPQI